MIDSQHLDGDDPAQPPVAAPADLCHPAPADHLAEFVAISEESLIGHPSPFPASLPTRTVPAPGPGVSLAVAPAPCELAATTERTTSRITAAPIRPIPDIEYRCRNSPARWHTASHRAGYSAAGLAASLTAAAPVSVGGGAAAARTGGEIFGSGGFVRSRA